jgi:hypothetical protein
MIEDLVRESLHERVAQPPALDDPADRAIAGARTVRRRRALTVACVIGVAAVLATGALTGLHGGPHMLPVPPASAPPSPSLAFIVDHTALRLPDGRSVSLPPSETALTGADQVREGWLVTGATADANTSSLWLVTPDAALHPLAQGLVGAPAVSVDGLWLSWRTATQLFSGHLIDSGALIVDSSTPMPDKGFPIAVTSTVVVLGATATGGGIDSFDLWLPAKGHYVASWDVITNVAAVYGPLPGGHSLLGLVRPAQGSKEVCLAELDPETSLRATRTACNLPLRVDPAGAVSPDGHWLAAVGSGGVALIDLTTVYDRPAIAATWGADWPGVWVDTNTMVVPAADGLQAFSVGDTAPRPVRVPGLPSNATTTPVPRHEPV